MEKYKTPKANCLISPSRISRIKAQGYDTGFTDEEIFIHAVGNRFAYQLCTLLFVTGLVLTSIPILAVAATIALLTVILPYHPFDYLYNYGVRHWLDRPKLPRRTAQAKFACGIAAIWLGMIIYLFGASLMVWGYVMGGILLIIALLVSMVDFCIPSLVYNYLFRKDKKVVAGK
ncbi:DUF4395 domain-containing protein [Fodinibius salsisoli]|uniref:DUF4395 domain-containing protein n=1 Tax=Fodinibius salsisoli TaxID=2820877 RepID=A0ABT3PJA3_9BACT|nr:DUF4395 domain-containing protein [Fodinibius salsisoli]MCW9706021.1 DUF4395 domain-containing protein [Fodinibius salsisoli]